MRYHLTQFLVVILLSTLTLIFYTACNKYASDDLIHSQTSPTVQRFFTANQPKEKYVVGLLNFVRRNNDKYKFVETMVDRIGYPRWDKAITVTQSMQGRNNLVDSTSITYIPFVKDSQNYVNASLAIKTELNDTSYQVFSDWQYSYFQYGSGTDSSAERFAVMFMNLDQNVFGNRTYNIIDPNLFVAELPGDTSLINRRDVTLSTLGRGARSLVYVTQLVEVCFLEYLVWYTR